MGQRSSTEAVESRAAADAHGAMRAADILPGGADFDGAAEELAAAREPSVCEAAVEATSASKATQPSEIVASLDLLPSSVWAEELGPLLQAVDVARLLPACRATSRPSVSAALVDAIAQGAHGAARGEIASLRSLHALDATPGVARADFESPAFLAHGACGSPPRVVSGAQLAYPMFVGGNWDKATTAMNPPAKGDAFELLMHMRRGRHTVKLSGWLNPYHGVLSVSLNGKVVGSAEGFDWSCTSGGCELNTEEHTFPCFEVEVDRTGPSVWRFEVVDAQKPEGYFMCLRHLEARCLSSGADMGDACVPGGAHAAPRFGGQGAYGVGGILRRLGTQLLGSRSDCKCRRRR